MKRVGILTFTNTINYGALFQAYALQKVLTDNGHIAEILQYTNSEIEKKEHNTGNKRKSIKGILKSVVMGRGINRKREAFDRFEAEFIRKGSCLNQDTLRETNAKYDCFITGSDQVWNMNITHGDWHYFLDFVEDEKKIISYAPSFGNVAFPKDKAEHAAQLLKRFKAISVREDSGKEKIRQICGRDAKVVLDPTLLINGEEWKKQTSYIPPLQKYILVYFPHNKDKTFAFVKKLKKRTGLPVVYLSISPRIQMGVRTIYDASPEEFLGWFINATYIVTGSFHGTAFSLNLGKQFFYEPSGAGSRIDNLVRLCEVDQRSIENEPGGEDIDYTQVDKKLEKMRADSLAWLLQHVEDSEGEGH